MAEITAPRPTERAMRCAVEMEIHAACSTMTIAKGHAIDKHFPGYDDMLAALKSLADTLRSYLAHMDADDIAELEAARAAIARAEGRTSDEEAA